MTQGIYELKVKAEGMATIWAMLEQAPAKATRMLMNDLQAQVTAQEEGWSAEVLARDTAAARAAELEAKFAAADAKKAADIAALTAVPKVLGPEDGFVKQVKASAGAVAGFVEPANGSAQPA